MQSIVKNILVPLNFSTSSINALRLGVEMGRRHNAKLHLLYINDTENLLPVASSYQLLSKGTDADKRPKIMTDIANSINKAHKLEVACHQGEGFVPDIICKKAEELNIDLIVVGNRSRQKNEFFNSSPIAYRVLKCAPCAVLVASAKKLVLSFENVLFPIRSTAHPEIKYPLAKSIIEKNNSSLYVIRLLSMNQQDNLLSIRKLITPLKDEVKKKRLIFFSEIAKRASHQVLTTGHKLNVDLIIVSASTKPSFWEYFTGTYTQKILREAKTAVLYVKSQDT